MEVNLIVTSGKHPGKIIPVSAREFVIGRAEGCQLRPQSDRVSRRHCLIRLEKGFAAVRDLGSSNGTFLNGQRLTAEQELKGGDRLQVGPLEFEVQLTVSVSGKRKPKVRNVQEAVARTVETAAGEEVDVSGWLDDEEDEGAGAVNETRPIAEAAAGPKADHPAAAGEEAKSDKPFSPFGADDPAKKVTTESSCEAAAEMLKHFLPRKR
jgi:pSer/pThr/pTyr-binding forkhead associated (FHA) protein